MKFVKLAESYIINLDQIAYMEAKSDVIKVRFSGVEEMVDFKGEMAKALIGFLANASVVQTV